MNASWLAYAAIQWGYEKCHLTYKRVYYSEGMSRYRDNLAHENSNNA
jgi:hypothetical protein